MTSADGRRWTDRSLLRDVQYRTDANLAARQSIYQWLRPELNLPSLALDIAGVRGGETVADVGCGNGAYLAELRRRGHAGPVLGIDMSAGMLHAARGHTPGAGLVAGDAAALPLRDAISDLTVAAHMLYHVPQPAEAVRELRRITRPGGQVLVVLNGSDHLQELGALISSVLPGRPAVGDGLGLDRGEELLASVFGSVVRHDFTAELLIPEPGPIEEYVRSMPVAQNQPDPGDFAAAVAALVPSGTFRVRAHTGCLVCR